MTTVNNISPELLAQVNKREGVKNEASAQSQQDKFLTLLVTQMKNQDPLNPMDNAQVTSQMAQLSTVTGIEKLNDTMEGMIGSVQASQTYQATSMIGRDVMISGNAMKLQDGQAKFAVELPYAAENVTVKIVNSNGSVVRTVDFGAQSAGLRSIGWDGMNDSGSAMPDGSYKFVVEATSGGTKVPSSSFAYGRVESINNDPSNVTANVEGVGAVALRDITRIL